ncbi:Uncharacterised protein [Serratia odorifera]|uniref:Uncharacterized protein n=1 Tax=Serratia odorifera TaxID=618 RepID=A0A3S4HLV8_SEROD|nr:Uncharacterised protein [Serratia odorifera]
MQLTFTLPDSREADALNVEIDHLVIAGWTGRDRQAILHQYSGVGRAGGAPTECSSAVLSRGGQPA